MEVARLEEVSIYLKSCSFHTAALCWGVLPSGTGHPEIRLSACDMSYVVVFIVVIVNAVVNVIKKNLPGQKNHFYPKNIKSFLTLTF